MIPAQRAMWGRERRTAVRHRPAMTSDPSDGPAGNAAQSPAGDEDRRRPSMKGRCRPAFLPFCLPVVPPRAIEPARLHPILKERYEGGAPDTDGEEARGCGRGRRPKRRLPRQIQERRASSTWSCFQSPWTGRAISAPPIVLPLRLAARTNRLTSPFNREP